MLGTLFAALLGAMSITGEFRHGTIRPTFLTTPRRGRVVAAKVWASMLIGVAFGLIAAAVAAGVGSAALAARGVKIQLDGGDYALLLAGGAAAAGLWAAIGVGLGAVVRNQVPTVVGLCAWLLFVEGLLSSATLAASATSAGTCRARWGTRRADRSRYSHPVSQRSCSRSTPRRWPPRDASQ